MAAAGTEYRHSKFLFVNRDNDEPMSFYMRPCADRAMLRGMIEHGGGVMTVKMFRNSPCTKIAMETDKVSTDDFISSKYVLDCVKHNKLLDTKDYRMKIKNYSGSDGGEDADNSVMSDLDIDDMSPASDIQTRCKELKGRMAYTVEEDVAMIKYLVENTDCKNLKGQLYFKDMASLKITEHSSESMLYRFKTKVLSCMDNYDVPDSWKFKLTGHLKYLRDSPKKKRTVSPKKPVSPEKQSSRQSSQSIYDDFDEDLLSLANLVPKDSPNKSENKKNTKDSAKNSKENCDKSDSCTDKNVNREKITDKNVNREKVTEKNVNKEKVTDKSVNREKVTDKNVNREKVTDKNVNREKVTDKNVNREKVTDKNVNREKVTEKNVSGERNGEKVTEKNASSGKSEGKKSDDKEEKRNRPRLRSNTSHVSDNKSSRTVSKHDSKGQEKRYEQLTQSPVDGRKVRKSRRLQEQEDNDKADEDEDQPSSSTSKSKKSPLPAVSKIQTRKTKNDRDQGDTDNSPPRKKERLSFVRNLDLSDEEESSQSQDEQSQDEERGTNKYIEENLNIAKKMASVYGLTLKEVLRFLYIHNGSFQDAQTWIETGHDSKGNDAWNTEDDEYLITGSNVNMAWLENKYGSICVKERQAFLKDYNGSMS